MPKSDRIHCIHTIPTTAGSFHRPHIIRLRRPPWQLLLRCPLPRVTAWWPRVPAFPRPNPWVHHRAAVAIATADPIFTQCRTHSHHTVQSTQGRFRIRIKWQCRQCLVHIAAAAVGSTNAHQPALHVHWLREHQCEQLERRRHRICAEYWLLQQFLRPIRLHVGRCQSHGVRVLLSQQLAEQWQLLERHQRAGTHAHERVQWPQHL